MKRDIARKIRDRLMDLLIGEGYGAVAALQIANAEVRRFDREGTANKTLCVRRGVTFTMSRG